MTHHDAGLTRRAALKGFAGLVIGFHLPLPARGQSGAGVDAGSSTFAPNAFIHIGTDDLVTVLVKHIEFGQGPFTGLATLVAEELDADWAQMRAKHAPSNPALYKNFLLGMQGTGGSTAIANSYDQMRKAGAIARAMLVQAAANIWNVPTSEVVTSAECCAIQQQGAKGVSVNSPKLPQGCRRRRTRRSRSSPRSGSSAERARSKSSTCRKRRTAKRNSPSTIMNLGC